MYQVIFLLLVNHLGHLLLRKNKNLNDVPLRKATYIVLDVSIGNLRVELINLTIGI
jgi:hypothetical protein